MTNSVGVGEEPLTDLATWTTVGTPFLTFRPDLASWWLPLTTVAAVAICAGFVLLLWHPFLEREAILEDADWIALVGTLALFGVVALLSLVATGKFALLILHWCRSRMDWINSRIAAGRYHSQWLAI